MKEMDGKIREKWRKGLPELEKVEMSDVVPVAGLIQARFSILYCELQTVLDMWASDRKITSGV